MYYGKNNNSEITGYHKKKHLPNALDNGYFDQSYFINEFKHLVGLKPTDYLLNMHSEENFYFEPIE